MTTSKIVPRAPRREPSSAPGSGALDSIALGKGVASGLERPLASLLELAPLLGLASAAGEVGAGEPVGAPLMATVVSPPPHAAAISRTSDAAITARGKYI